MLNGFLKKSKMAQYIFNVYVKLKEKIQGIFTFSVGDLLKVMKNC